jgi:hypothetical protein
LAQHSGKAQPAKKHKKNRKCRKPCILKIHEGSREIMPFGRLAIIVQEKKVWAGPGNFLGIFDQNAGLCANVCGSPQLERGLWEPLSVFGSL